MKRLALALLLAGPAVAGDTAGPALVDVVQLKSGAFVQIEADGLDRMTVVRPEEEGAVLALACPMVDAADWASWARFFDDVGAERLPATRTVSGGQAAGCVADAKWGSDARTQNVVTLTLRARVDGADADTVLSTPISRREAEALGQHLARMGTQATSRPTKAAGPVIVDTQPEACDDAIAGGLAVLYAAKSWSRRDEIGWKADEAALRKAVDGGADLSVAVARALADRRVRAGTLADLLGVELAP